MIFHLKRHNTIYTPPEDQFVFNLISNLKITIRRSFDTKNLPPKFLNTQRNKLIRFVVRKKIKVKGKTLFINGNFI